MKYLINLDQVTKIFIYYKKENSDIVYHYKPHTLCELLLDTLGKLKPYYLLRGYRKYTLKEIDKWASNNNCYIEDKYIYYYPHLEIYQSDGECIKRYYNSVDELNSELEVIKKNMQNIMFYEYTK